MICYYTLYGLVLAVFTGKKERRVEVVAGRTNESQYLFRFFSLCCVEFSVYLCLERIGNATITVIGYCTDIYHAPFP
jgi:hypothetical protein